ncbi:MAG: metallophosphoesterase [Bacteroidota bacterium]
MNNATTLLILVLLLASCGSTRKAYIGNNRNAHITQVQSEQPPVHSLFLIGDTGAGRDGESIILESLANELGKSTENSSIVFLGDQVDRNGFPKKKDPDREEAERRLGSQLEILKDFPGRAYFIAGEKDWNNGHSGGLKAVRRQEKFLEGYFNDEDKVRMYPGKGCADPKVVKVTKDLVFVFIDSQWWQHNWDNEPEINKGCDVKSRYDLINSIQEIFADHKNDEIVLLMHHPIQSNGLHGGRFGLTDHIFPYRSSHNLSIPLPVIGSIRPLLRTLGTNPQDITHQRYQELITSIEAAARRVGAHTIFASAHDQGLQYFDDYKLQYVVSGSGATTSFTGKGGEATYSHQAHGYAKVIFYEEFETWLEFYTVAEQGAVPQLAFRTQVREPRPGTVDEEVDYPPLTDADITLPANAGFEASKSKQFWWGDQYRDVWTQPVTARIINLETELGGLTPIKKGGGMSSNSLRMEATDGKQYILRSINKDYRKLVPPEFSNLSLISVFQDQNSASHPYAALTLPTLSRAADVYYTSPQLVYLQHQPGLDNYNSQFPEELYLLEQRPANDWSDTEQFGNSEKILGYTDLLVNLREKKTHFVDQEWVCKSRIFDLFIHDFDRHDDQWRWASFKDDDQTLYRPIPRDRDQAFYKFRGLIPKYIAAFVIPKFKTMKGDLRDAKNQSFNARYFDRYFLNQLEWKDWEPIIRELQTNLTDEVIDEAMQQFPPEVIGESTAEIGQFLRERRGNLMEMGRRLYDYISLEVEVTGTDHKDRFEIQSNEDGSLQVKTYVQRKEKGDLLKFSRTFYPSETNEIRLYGLRGKDEFNFTGDRSGRIRVRIIGGEDDDIINNEIAYKVFVYDETEGIELNGSRFRDRTSDTDYEVNEYDRYSFRYNTILPILTLGYTVDDGIWIGGTVDWTRHGWRKFPYKSKQGITSTVAPGSREAFQFGYSGHFPKVLGGIDFAPSAEVNFPRYESYFGLGNESRNELLTRSFNWVRLQSIEVAPLLQISSRNNSTSVMFGPVFESIDVKNTEGRVSEDPIIGFAPMAFDRRQYLGGMARFNSSYTDNNVFPTSGFRFEAEVKHLEEIDLDESVTTFQTSGQLYMKIAQSPLLVFANGIGYQKVWGTPQFHQYADLGNRSNFRGFRNERFRGESAFYHNVDLRIRLLQSKNNILPVDVGLVGGFDYGRVWLDGEESDTWHNSQTIGLWIDVLGLAVLQPYYSFNNEQNLFSFRLGFNF